jgi:hypothetical protein
MCLSHGDVVSDMLALIWLTEVADREVSLDVPPLNECARFIRRAVVYDEPLKVLVRLRAKAFVWAVEQVRPVIGGRKDSEERCHRFTSLLPAVGHEDLVPPIDPSRGLLAGEMAKVGNCTRPMHSPSDNRRSES